ncbi:hypothetical protein K438DRAFT_979332 [Mycena galopus ATCC 62051]|nr:hypothetical protein K438DRAFT_979332 [Mycena galopus ATCC 62051]
MCRVKFRKNVYKWCGKDIVRFIWKKRDGTEKIVGGVRYKPFSKTTLQRMLHNHRLAVVRAIRRRGLLQYWAYGTMSGSGSRQPAGGKEGDGYAAYAWHRGDTEDNIKSTMREGLVSVFRYYLFQHSIL